MPLEHSTHIDFQEISLHKVSACPLGIAPTLTLESSRSIKVEVWAGAETGAEAEAGAEAETEAD